MQQLANITVTPKPGHLFDSWNVAGQWLSNMNLAGFEIYPHGELNAEDIPAKLVGGFHLQSFPILTPLLYNDSSRLMKIFGDWKTVEQFYGGTDADHIVNTMVSQLNLAAKLNAPYAVFHPMDCDMENLFTQDFPWTLDDTFAACAELLNLALRQSNFKGWLLFENMWWKQSFRLDSRQEYDKLRSRINYAKCGICFDTGHMMATNTSLFDESGSISFLMNRLHQLDLSSEIKTLHLNSSLKMNSLPNGSLVDMPDSKQAQASYQDYDGFWAQFDVALQHISGLDPHNGFKRSDLSRLIEVIDPDYLVHEITQNEIREWQQSIRQQQACLSPVADLIEWKQYA